MIIAKEITRLLEQSKNIKASKISVDIYQQNLHKQHVLHPEDDTAEIKGVFIRYLQSIQKFTSIFQKFAMVASIHYSCYPINCYLLLIYYIFI